MLNQRTDNKRVIAKILDKFTLEVSGYLKKDGEALAQALYERYQVEAHFLADDFHWANISEYWKNTVIPHKIAVFEAGIELLEKDWFTSVFPDVNPDQFQKQLWLHDLSKFSAAESYDYCYYFNSELNFHLLGMGGGGVSKADFERTWHHHKVNNPHHPEHWWNVARDGSAQPLPMPPIYVAEMLADWIGAGKTYGTPLAEWLESNLDFFRWHFATSLCLTNALQNMGFVVGARHIGYSTICTIQK